MEDCCKKMIAALEASNLVIGDEVAVQRGSYTAGQGTPNRHQFPVKRSERTRGFVVQIQADATENGGTAAILRYRLFSRLPADRAQAALGSNEGMAIAPEETVQIPIPAWRDEIRLDGVGIQQDDPTAQADVSYTIVVYELVPTYLEDC